jgi:hypothetical protein
MGTSKTRYNLISHFLKPDHQEKRGFANAEDASEATEDLIESCDQSPTMVSVIGSLGRCPVPQATLRMPW